MVAEDLGGDFAPGMVESNNDNDRVVFQTGLTNSDMESKMACSDIEAASLQSCMGSRGYVLGRVS